MDEKRKEEINEKLDNIDWYHENISEIMESFANSINYSWFLFH